MVSRHDIDRWAWVLRLKWQGLTDAQRRQFLIVPAVLLTFVAVGVLAFWPSDTPAKPLRPGVRPPPVLAPLDMTPVPDAPTDLANLEKMTDSDLRAEYERRSRIYGTLVKSGSFAEKSKAWTDMKRVNSVMEEREKKRRAEAVAPKAPPPKPPPTTPIFPR